MVTRTAEHQDYGTAKVLSASAAGANRARRAVDMALQCLAEVEPDDEVRGLVERGERLRSEIEQWGEAPPSPESRDAVMRDAVSMQVAAVSLLRRLR